MPRSLWWHTLPRAGLALPEPPLSPTVSQIVTQDYCEVVQQLELEQDLRLHAEAFAHEVRPAPKSPYLWVLGGHVPTAGQRARGLLALSVDSQYSAHCWLSPGS